MRAQLVGGPTSRLHGARCTLCQRTVKGGDAVIWHHTPNDSYDEDRLVTHVDCMRALLDRAPAGRPVTDHRARAAAIRHAVLRSGNPYAEVA